jgi:hypothetical protein
VRALQAARPRALGAGDRVVDGLTTGQRSQALGRKHEPLAGEPP